MNIEQEKQSLKREMDVSQTLLSVLNERTRQFDKWGVQKHSLCEWLTILAEEHGELAQAILNAGALTCDQGKAKAQLGDSQRIYDEAIQVAAVALCIAQYVKTGQA